DRGDPAHRNAFGEERAHSGGDDQIAGGDAGAIARHKLEAKPSARLAFHETGCARALDHRSHRGGGVVEKLDHGSTRPNLGDAAAIDGEGPGPPSAFAADDLAGERSERKPVAKGEKTPQPAILLIRLANLQRLHTETLVVRPEGRVLAPDRSPVREGVPGAEG